MDHDLREKITTAMDLSVQSLSPLSGGCVGEVYRVKLTDGTQTVVKVDRSVEPCLDVEASMLRYLRRETDLPVPSVFVGQPELLIMEFVEHDGRRGKDAQIEAADALVALHDIGSSHYGFETDTLIGGLRLPNQETDDWLEFFGRCRLCDMAARCVDAGMLDDTTYGRVESLAHSLDEFVEAPNPPGLIHGDIWSGNVLYDAGHLAAFIDPAIYFADPEMELAFIGMFHTFGDSFYARYGESRPIGDGFFEIRRDLYNLFPLLVHIRLFGGSYIQSLRSTLDQLGF